MSYRVVFTDPQKEYVMADELDFEEAHKMATSLNAANGSRNPNEPASITVTL